MSASDKKPPDTERDTEVAGGADPPLAPDPPPPPESPPPRKHRYALGDALGEGGMAFVYEADDPELLRKVAVKCLRPELADKGDLLERFKDEAQIMAALDHPGSLPVFDLGEMEDGRHYYAMKKVRGKTLYDLIMARGVREVRDRATMHHYVDIFERACQTMAAAHAQGIIHRDLKPENIMVDEFGAVYVLDWGLAKRLPKEGDPTDSLRTRVGVTMGTPAYMSPEQARGHAFQSDQQSDVFSLGILLYEILTGVHPFITSSSQEAMKGILYTDPDPPRKHNRTIPRELAAICLKALNKDPAQRYPSAKELADDIRAYREFRSVSAIRPRLIDHLWNWARRHPVTAAVLATLVVVLSLAAFLVGGQIVTLRAVLAEVHEEIDADYRRIAEIDTDLEGIEKRLLRAVSRQERLVLQDARAELEAKREFRRQRIEGMAHAVTGFTVASPIFPPDARTQEIVRQSLLASIDGSVEEGRYLKAAAALRDATESYEKRNYYGLTLQQCEDLKKRLLEVEAMLEEKRKRYREATAGEGEAGRQP